MNEETVIRLAREAGITQAVSRDPGLGTFALLDRFAALVAQEVFEGNFQHLIELAQRKECMACALTCEQAGIDGYGTLAAAALIRARRKL